MRKLFLIWLALGCLNFIVVTTVSAGEKGLIKAYTKQLRSGPLAELPAQSATIISQAPTKEKEATTVAVVKAALSIAPASAPAIVGAIASVNPEISVLAARTAAGLLPAQSAAIAKAAAAAAPAYAVQIAAAVGKEVPLYSRDVAVAVSDAVPKSRVEIMTAATPTPAAVAGSEAPSTLPPGSLRGPSIQPPYIPLSSPPTNAPSGNGEVPPGGRDYARP